MGLNITQDGTKHSLKQPKTTKSSFGSFHQFEYLSRHNMNFRLVFGRLL